MKRVSLCIVLLAGVCLLDCSAKVRITPVGNLSLYGGQYYLDDEPSSFGGNSSIYYSPVFNFSEKSALVPVINVDYSGVRSVQDIVGGGTLTRESIDGGATMKYVQGFGSWKIKARIGWKNSFINETADEKWGEGLFDYNRLLFSTALHRIIAGHDFSLTADYYTVSFPNYSSLIYEEEYQTSIDTETYTELSANAGEDVLDYSNISVSLAASKRYSANFNAYYGYRLDLRGYKDQTLVQSDGSFAAGKRKDSVNTVYTGLGYKIKRTAVELEHETCLNKSNQNSYDANATKYNEDFYSYYSMEFTPAVAFYLGSNKRLSRLKFWWAIKLKRYAKRQAQDKNADYQDDKVHQTDNGFGVSYRYPIIKGMYAVLNANRRIMSSNMKYEGNYKYNYILSNYYFGLTWQFGHGG